MKTAFSAWARHRLRGTHYTDQATLACTPQGLQLIDPVDGLDLATLLALLSLPVSR